MRDFTRKVCTSVNTKAILFFVIQYVNERFSFILKECTPSLKSFGVRCGEYRSRTDDLPDLIGTL